MMRSSSLEKRVTWAVAGTVAAFLLALSLLAYEGFARMEDDLVNRVLKVQVDTLRSRILAGQGLPTETSIRGPDAEDIQAWLVPSHAAHALPPGSKPVTQVAQQGGRTWHTWIEPTPRGTLYVRYDATAHEARVHTFGGLLAGGAAAALLCAWLLARQLARRVVAPIRTVSARLSGWGVEGTPHVVVPEGDEAAQLIAAFSLTQDRVDRAIALERRFAANLSHELRTPLSALRSDCEMVLLDLAPDAPLRARLLRMVAQVDAAASSLSGAVAFSRVDPARTRTVDIRELLEEAWFAMGPRAQVQGLVLENQIPEGTMRHLDPHALLVVMRNLMRNAIEHAAPARLTVRVDDDGALVFHDDGPGLSGQVLKDMRGWRAGRVDLSPTPASLQKDPAVLEHGLGLGIAQHICDLQSWRLTADAAQAPGASWTEFRVMLPLLDTSEKAI